MKLYVTKKSAGIQYIVEENDAPVCRMATQSKVAPEHIVHCVNNHDALVDALDKAISIEALPRALRDMREARGMTQFQAGDIIGVCPRTISNWESGHRVPKWSSLVLLVGAYGCKVEIGISVDERES